MDALDSKILKELFCNSRMPITTLAKKVRASREVVTYRIKRLSEKGIIAGFITEIDYQKLGFVFASFMLTISKDKEKEFIDYVNSRNFTAWNSEFTGVWNYGIGIFGKDEKAIQKNFLLIYNKFKDHILKYQLLLHQKTENYYEKYVGITMKSQRAEKLEISHLDIIDKKILKLISGDSRRDSIQLSKKLSLTAPAIASRIRKLQKSGVIKRFTLFIDPSKVDLFQYSVFVSSNTEQNHMKLFSYCRSHLKISFCVDFWEKPFVEFGVIVLDPFELRNVLRDFETMFPDNSVIETFLIQRELRSIQPASCLFK